MGVRENSLKPCGMCKGPSCYPENANMGGKFMSLSILIDFSVLRKLA